jgi:phenylacetate-CoA ligase
MDAYGTIYNKLLFPLWERRIRRRPTLDLLAELERSQHFTRDRLIDLQVTRLRELLAHAGRHVPFYRDRFAAAGFDPGALRSRDDLLRIPVLSRVEARAAGDARMSEVPPRATIAKATSGSSGQPIAFAYDEGSEHWRQAVKLRGYGWAGLVPGARTLHYWGGATPMRRTALQKAKVAVDRLIRRDVYVDCGPASKEQLDLVVERIRRAKPQAMACYAQSGAVLARHVNEHRLRDWDDFSVVCGAEALHETDRADMKKAFGPHVFNTYGSREFMLMATECPEHDGLHVSMENLVVEILVDEGTTKRHARPGEVGEVVVTDLHNFGMPFIRYANGDLAVAGGPETCRCGRALERISSIEGRVTEAMRDSAGGRVSGLAVCAVIAHVGSAVHAFQAVQKKDGSITLKIVPGPGWNADVAGHLVKSLSPYFKGFSLDVAPVKDIPAAKSGKRSVIVVERD